MENQTGQPRPSSTKTSNVDPSDKQSPKTKWWRKLKTLSDSLLKMDRGQWLEDMRENLSIVAALISAITFQAALNPPGGVGQASPGPQTACNSTLDQNNLCPGEAVLGTVYPLNYFIFLWCNTLSFIGSLSAALLLVSGIPLRHRFPMWFLSIAMCLSLTFLAITYVQGVLLLTPSQVFGAAVESLKIFMWIWIAFLGLVFFYFIVRFLVWVVKICRKQFKCLKNKENTSDMPENNVA